MVYYETMNSYLQKKYRQFGYPSVRKFYTILDKKVPESTIRDFVRSQSVAQIHQKKVMKQGHITADFVDERFQIDLLDMSSLSRSNQGMKWIFICVDVFSRYSWAEPMKTKQPTDTAKALTKIMNESSVPKVINSDNGTEWKGTFAELLKANNIIHNTNEIGDHQALGIIDRYSQYIKNTLYKHMTNTDSAQWIDYLDTAVKAYNNSPHSAIDDLTPKKARKKSNSIVIHEINLEKRNQNQDLREEPEVGDIVRMKVAKGKLDRGYTANYSTETYKVEDVSAKGGVLPTLTG